MKRKPDPLEKLLRRAEARPPRGLRTRALQRIGLRPAPSAWPSALGRRRLSVRRRGLAWALLPSLPQAQAPGRQGDSSLRHRSSRPRACPSARAARSGPEAGNPAPQQPGAQAPQEAVLASKPEAESSVPVTPLAATRAALVAGSGQPLTHRGPSAASNASGRAQAAQGDTTWPALTPTAPLREHLPWPIAWWCGQSHRPALNERVRLELQVADYGRVRIRLFDAQGRF